jgi:hypothetical protein
MEITGDSVEAFLLALLLYTPLSSTSESYSGILLWDHTFETASACARRSFLKDGLDEVEVSALLKSNLGDDLFWGSSDGSG